MKAKVLVENKLYDQANTLLSDSLKGVEHHLLPLWRDWLVLSIKAYEESGKIEWAQSALAILPYALRYKTQKTKLILAPILRILSKHQK